MRWKSRAVAFTTCFVVGFVVAAIVTAILSRRGSSKQDEAPPCAAADYFISPESVLGALKHPEVEVRKAIRKRLLLRPDVATVYYDYERDLEYPERADHAELKYVQLDAEPGEEAVVTFLRLEHPVGLIFKKKSCGWRLVTAVSSWLRFEDYPYVYWLTTPESIEPGVHQLAIRESYSDGLRYFRNVRVLRLTGDALTQVAKIEEESLEPVADYDGADGDDVKLHRVNRIEFSSERQGGGAHIRNDITEEIIKLDGAAPQYNYWLDTDGSWHSRFSSWHHRHATRLKLLSESREFLNWNSQEGRFIKQ